MLPPFIPPTPLPPISSILLSSYLSFSFFFSLPSLPPVTLALCNSCTPTPTYPLSMLFCLPLLFISLSLSLYVCFSLSLSTSLSLFCSTLTLSSWLSTSLSYTHPGHTLGTTTMGLAATVQNSSGETTQPGIATPSVLRETLHVHRAHARRNNHFSGLSLRVGSGVTGAILFISVALSLSSFSTCTAELPGYLRLLFLPPLGELSPRSALMDGYREIKKPRTTQSPLLERTPNPFFPPRRCGFVLANKQIHYIFFLIGNLRFNGKSLTYRIFIF